MGQTFIGELVVEFPPSDPPNYLKIPAGLLAAAYDRTFGQDLKMIQGITKLSLHFDTKGPITADLTFIDKTTQTWLVVGFRERA